MLEAQAMGVELSKDERPFVRPYLAGGMRAYFAKMSDELLDHVRSFKSVRYVERNLRFQLNLEKGQQLNNLHFEESTDTVHSSTCTASNTDLWGLKRITVTQLPLPTEYIYDATGGEGVHVFVLDTGIKATLPAFGGRVYFGADFVNTPALRNDPSGHGTHVAGTIMSTPFGVAKKAFAVDVRVIDANNRCTVDAVLSGLNYALQYRQKKNVINLSLSLGTKVQSIVDAVAAAVRNGIHVVSAAGNDAVDACLMSPADAPDGITVAASDQNDLTYVATNYGTCVSIFAPGVDIVSVSKTGGSVSMTGTSMAAPHVSGVIAVLLGSSASTISPAVMKNDLIGKSSRNMLTPSRNMPNTRNRLLYNSCSG
ncbi:hypothetical protein EMCRGX_G010632 [Ephydatia muelleri]